MRSRRVNARRFGPGLPPTGGHSRRAVQYPKPFGLQIVIIKINQTSSQLVPKPSRSTRHQQRCGRSSAYCCSPAWPLALRASAASGNKTTGVLDQSLEHAMCFAAIAKVAAMQNSRDPRPRSVGSQCTINKRAAAALKLPRIVFATPCQRLDPLGMLLSSFWTLCIST